MDIVFLSLDEVVSIHQNQIALYGGSLGLRDQGLLQAAIAVPQQTFGGRFLHSGVPAMAAAYLFHLVKNHPFVDGNKRVGAAAAIVFLLMNDHHLACREDEYAETALGVANGSVSKDVRIGFFQEYVRPQVVE